MGQQSKPRPETPKAPPSPVSRTGVMDGDGGGEGSPVLEFCQMEHSLRVEFTAGAVIAPGDPVRLVVSSPPRVLSAGEDIGEVRDSSGQAMLRCLIDGYEMSGVVDLVDLTGRQGQISVSGREKD